MDVEVRLATAQDRDALELFYSREGMDFSSLSVSNTFSVCVSRETMYIIATTQDIVVAALKLDIADDPSLGDIGFIQHFEIEDELEQTDLGEKMLSKAVEIADDKNLRALDALVSEERKDLVKMYFDNMFEELRKEIYLRRKFRPSPF